MADQPKKKGGKLFKIAIGIVLILALAFAGAYAYGMSLPETFKVTKEIDINRWDVGVYEVLEDAEHYARWSSGIKEVKNYKKLSDGTSTWTDVFSEGGMTMDMHMTEAKKPGRIRIDVVNNQMFTGHWEFEIAETNHEPGKQVTHVKLTEVATIPNPMMRVGFSLMGHVDKVLETHLADLKKKCESDKPKT